MQILVQAQSQVEIWTFTEFRRQTRRIRAVWAHIRHQTAGLNSCNPTIRSWVHLTLSPDAQESLIRMSKKSKSTREPSRAKSSFNGKDTRVSKKKMQTQKKTNAIRHMSRSKMSEEQRRMDLDFNHQDIYIVTHFLPMLSCWANLSVFISWGQMLLSPKKASMRRLPQLTKIMTWSLL